MGGVLLNAQRKDGGTEGWRDRGKVGGDGRVDTIITISIGKGVTHTHKSGTLGYSSEDPNELSRTVGSFPWPQLQPEEIPA